MYLAAKSVVSQLKLLGVSKEDIQGSNSLLNCYKTIKLTNTQKKVKIYKFQIPTLAGHSPYVSFSPTATGTLTFLSDFVSFTFLSLSYSMALVAEFLL